MPFKKTLTMGILILLIGALFPMKSQSQSPNHQYVLLNRVAYYKVKVKPEIVGWTNEGFRINFIILEGRINGIISGEFVKDRDIVVNGSSTINGDQATILSNGVGSMSLKSKIVTDDGIIFILSYTGAFHLTKFPLKYPIVFLTAVITLSTEIDNPRYDIITQKNYLGKGELNVLTNEVSYRIYPTY